MKTAIVGLPMTGKTSLFTILTGVHESTRMGSTEARIGITKVPDLRLDALAKIYEPPKVTHATVEFLDFPSISKEALRDPGYLGSLRVADAIAHVVRVFEDDTVPHEKGSVDPLRDIEDVDVELILSDLVVVEKRLERLEKDRKKAHGAELEQEFDLLTEAKQKLEANETLRGWELTKEGDKMMRGFQFLSQKPMLIVLNLGEADAPRLAEVEAEYAAKLLTRKIQHGSHRDLRQDRSRTGRTEQGRARGVYVELRSAGLQSRPHDRGGLPSARPDEFSDCR